ncbi:hypothetical protein CPT03_13515 [Pedobacter ginsengisoli]|uniref:Uncharacterized protein n=1 Tax=Pedobacter ginsengisoli TaxID=363852 RepID=A0A2D1U736_9SPHI|nr:hypothetical protein [Pedobacter ginsengisoli]ATP57416.1 hypothetical protein CPT03_13515 [Pedobacter ginsengisoli]
MIIEAHQRIKGQVTDLENLLVQKGYPRPFLATYQQDGKTLSDSLKYLMLTHEVLGKKLPKLSLVSQDIRLKGGYRISCIFSLDYTRQKGLLITSMEIICLNSRGLTRDYDHQQVNSHSALPQFSRIMARVVPADLKTKQKHKNNLTR